MHGGTEQRVHQDSVAVDGHEMIPNSVHGTSDRRNSKGRDGPAGTARRRRGTTAAGRLGVLAKSCGNRRIKQGRGRPGTRGSTYQGLPSAVETEHPVGAPEITLRIHKDGRYHSSTPMTPT